MAGAMANIMVVLWAALGLVKCHACSNKLPSYHISSSFEMSVSMSSFRKGPMSGPSDLFDKEVFAATGNTSCCHVSLISALDVAAGNTACCHFSLVSTPDDKTAAGYVYQRANPFIAGNNDYFSNLLPHSYMCHSSIQVCLLSFFISFNTFIVYSPPDFCQRHFGSKEATAQ